MKKCFISLLCIILTGYITFPVQSMEGAVDVISCAGEVKVVPPGEMEAVPCQRGMRLKEGARVITGKGAYIELAFDRSKRNIVKVKENSEVVIKLDGNEKIELIDGEIFTLLRGLAKGETFRVRTPCITCGARGTGWRTETDSGITSVAVFDGRVFVRGLKRDGSPMERERWVEKGFEIKVKRFERPGRLERISDARLSRMEKEIKFPPRLRGKEPEKSKGKPRLVISEPGVRETGQQQKETALKEKSDRVIGEKDRLTVKIEKVAEQRERLRKRMEKREDIDLRESRGRSAERLIERRARMEKRTERADRIRQERKESILERKDEKKLDKIREEHTGTSGNSSLNIKP